MSKSVDVNALGDLNDPYLTTQDISINGHGLNPILSKDSLGLEAPDNDRNVSNQIQ